MTKQDRIISALTAGGAWKEAPSPSRKYRKLVHVTQTGAHTVYWVGKCGSLRSGPTVTESHSITYLLAAHLR